MQLSKNSTGYTSACDIWSLGCTVIEMVIAEPPWRDRFPEPQAAMFHIASSEDVPDIPSSLSPVGKDFLQKTLQRNPFLRYTASQLLQHPFIHNQ
jgi:mitogen-activated protein kinase kinase kinase